MKNVLDVLKERGYVKQIVFEDELYELLGRESVTFYTGYDPTADSLHVGHFVALMAMAHMQRAGHRPVVLIGGGTAMVGDPSGRTDMRSMLTKEAIRHNVDCFKKQMSRFIDFSDGKAIVADNADWLCKLNYVDFLRDVGACFSVNQMLTAECFKQRLERGLSFLEFNYMLMQGYDFLELYKKYGCMLELGGDDQWSNILAGANLIRVKERKPAYAMTFTLLTTSEGKKMGKTEKGAVWLDESKTSPYEFYQYWRNIADADVEKCLKLLTFLPLEEIDGLVKFNDERINKAKEVLAYELTKLVHGEEKAAAAQAQARAAFGGGGGDLPEKDVKVENATIIPVLVAAGICASNGEARRLIQQGGVSLNDDKVTDIDTPVSDGDVIHKGKKVHVKINLK